LSREDATELAVGCALDDALGDALGGSLVLGGAADVTAATVGDGAGLPVSARCDGFAKSAAMPRPIASAKTSTKGSAVRVVPREGTAYLIT
jgi:hypothetical protein